MEQTLSVIIPAYQAEKYIDQAIGTVRQQRWDGQTEIIVVDDGSSDATADRAEALGVTVLGKERGGAASARNMGLRASSGSSGPPRRAR